MKTVRRLSVILVICILCGAFLVSCNNNKDEQSSQAYSGETSDNPYYNSTTGKYVASTSGKKYDGEVITFLTCGVNNTHQSEIVFNTYEDGEAATLPTVVNEDLKNRADYLEEQLGVTIEETYVFDLKRKNAEMANTIRTGNLTGTDDYQVVVPCLYDGATLAIETQFYNLLDVNGLQIEAPWWNQTFNSGMIYGGQLYFSIGDIGLINKDSCAALFFNYDMWYKLGLQETYGGDPYELVREHKWTIDLVSEVTKSISKDLDTNGKIDYNDEFGWGGQLDDMWSLFYGSGERIAKADAEGYPSITIYNTRSATVMEKMQELVQNKNSYVSANDYFDVVQWPSVLVQQAFTDGRCMFYNGAVGTVIELGSNMNAHFGMVPIPLADESQDDYYSLVNPWTSTCFAIPISVVGEKLTMTADVLNVLGAESKNTVAESYYEIAIKYMKIRDDESIEMIDKYIFPTRGCDVGMVYGWGGLDALLQTMASESVGTFASNFEQKQTAAQTALDETISFYKDHE